jgi:ribosomal protein S12 methylthiotransferase
MRTRRDKSERINIITLGCSKNLVDSEFLMKQIRANNLDVIHNAESYQYKTVIINTCGFIRDAKQESVDTILRFIKAKERGLIRHVFVMGCLSERYKTDLEKEIPDVDQYFGTNDLSAIIDHLGLEYKQNLIGERWLTTPSHYAYLKISEGCDRKCAFCAIPLMRGKHVSRPVGALKEEGISLAAKGVKELILIAQDLTWYGIDLYKMQALPGLLENLAGINGIEWIRLHYAYPASFPMGVIRVMKERENICRYLDIPFQHASDKVLKMMRRNHFKKQNYDLIEKIRKEIPGITLRTTLMTGHPGEGEKEFSELRRFVEDVEFDRLGVFTYSEEEDTWSAKQYKDIIPAEVKKARADELMALQQSISNKLNNNKINKSIKVLIDGREGEYYLARSESDSPEVDNEILIPVSGRELQNGMFYIARITGAEEYDLYAEVTEQPVLF